MREDINGRVYEHAGELPPHLRRLHRRQQRQRQAERGTLPPPKPEPKPDLADSPLNEIFGR